MLDIDNTPLYGEIVIVFLVGPGEDFQEVVQHDLGHFRLVGGAELLGELEGDPLESIVWLQRLLTGTCGRWKGRGKTTKWWHPRA